MGCELPCEDFIFNSEHPFSDPNFRFTRQTTISEGFHFLFQDISNQTSSSPYFSPISPRESNTFELTTPLVEISQSQHDTLLSEPIGTSNPWPAGGPLTNRASRALYRWREQWLELCNKMSSNEWSNVGLSKTGYNFYLVSQLLLNMGSTGGLCKMEGNCEDRLEQLKVLLPDDYD
ncbi:hypothetical protein N7508_005973 [Penicillium antarcticum]|uniref:uncharacterized protein n=1 Tax=Penicillium antarcticum TaxID=416450 RepID=UPI00238A8F55|nr:uncharacterized protein N7508_005973 [Penicillium antarcticum]KAJ5306958.1 hypothetical protein N7508_005973 [Penicillium antarcticum]